MGANFDAGMLGDTNSNGRKRGRSPPDVDDECTPISKRIAGLTLETNQSYTQVNHYAPIATNGEQTHQGIPPSYQQQSHLAHQQIPQPYQQQQPMGYQQVPLSYEQQQPMGYEQVPLSYQQQPDMAHLQMPPTYQQQQPIFNDHQPQYMNGGGLNSLYSYNPNIQNSLYYTNNQMLHSMYIERMLRTGKPLHPAFYERR